MLSSKKVIIVGGNASGLSAASQVKRINPSWHIVVLEKGNEVSYGSCGIPYYIQNTVDSYDKLFTLSKEKIIKERDIDLRISQEVTDIHPEKNQVTILDHNNNKNNHYTEDYDYLIIASGVIASTRPVIIHDSKRVFTVRGVEDGKEIKDFIYNKQPKSVGIIGGGYIALELVEAFYNMGLDTTLVHRRDKLNKAFSPEISDQILDYLKEKGVNLQLNTEVQEIFEKGEKVVSVTKDGSNLSYDMLVLSIGVTPNTEFIKGSGIELGLKNSIKVNKYLQTNYSNIYAAGDVVQTTDMVTKKPTFSPLALKANKEGTIAGINVANEKNIEEYPGVLRTSILKIFETGVARTGLSQEEAISEGFEAKTVFVQSASRAGYYPNSDKMQIQATIDQNDGKILGAQIIGPLDSVKRIDVFAVLIQFEKTIEDAYKLDLAYAPPFSPVYDPVILTGRVGKKFIK